jgi:DNA-directed RNA polymerase specialized sigma24 family protein
MSSVPKTDPSLSRSEVEAQLRAFKSADWQRANTIAAIFCGGLTGWTAHDLLQETVTKLLEGTRTWPVGIHPLVVLKTAMHSIASNARKRNNASPIDDAVVLDPADEFDGEATPTAHGKVTITPEDMTSGKQQLDAVFAAVSGDDEIELLVMAWADGLRGEQAMQELDWNKKQYDAARKRLNRRLEAIDPGRRMKL